MQLCQYQAENYYCGYQNFVVNASPMRNPPLLRSGMWSGWSDTWVPWDTNLLCTGGQRGSAGLSRKHSNASCEGIDRIRITLHKHENYQVRIVYETPCSKGAALTPVSGYVTPNKALSAPQSFWSLLSASWKECCIWRWPSCLTGWTTFHTVAVADFLFQWHLPQYYIKFKFKLGEMAWRWPSPEQNMFLYNLIC
jgi:hypothetical protein